ncbi:DUF6461 domain-containing protein [Actinokineospora sp. NBRC 105648]|uniref:DUF6461 domain-containing protein n=1 Tax=Actinokineospora sp. NBRC 105648 TaxID=3032206 RepID=UPI0024A1169B|nr:DUF6461 domain-containing protein [Actinokineospora sp. NBRC 105648]GLZ41889.1 hypothetical protein Acsp05_55130 [Actinokineospora sp. NBRC 105648]
MSNLSELVKKYTWVEPLARELVWCVSVVDGKSAGDVISVFGGDRSAAEGVMTVRQAEDVVQRTSAEFGEFFLCQVFQRGSHVIVLENNGYSGSIPELARRVSANGGKYFSYFRNVNGDSSLVQARDGKVVAYFDPMLVDDGPHSGDVYPDWALGVRFEPGSARATSFALMEQQTGLEFDPVWFDLELPTYRIPDPYAMLKDVEGVDLP